MLFLVGALIRLAWSLTIGLPFFALGLVLFLLLDIFQPRSNAGYRTLVSIYKFASLGLFKGLRVERDEFDLEVEKKRLS